MSSARNAASTHCAARWPCAASIGTRAAISSMISASRSWHQADEAPGGGAGMAVSTQSSRALEMWYSGIASWKVRKVIPLDGSAMMLRSLLKLVD